MLKNFSLVTKMSLTIIIAILLFITSFIILLVVYRSSLLEDKEKITEHYVDIAFHNIKYFYKKYREQELTENQAKQCAIRAIEGIRYDEDNYFFIINYELITVMHPINTKLNGKSVATIKDNEGNLITEKGTNTPFFKAMVDKSRASENHKATVIYQWPHPTNLEEYVDKMSMVRAFEPWQWVIGTGIYLMDIDTLMMEAILFILIIALGISAIITIIIIVIARTISQNTKELITKLDRIGKGDLKVQIMVDSRDELGKIANIVNNHLVKNLKNIISMIKQNSVVFQEATRQMATGNQDLSERTTYQASSIEQISGTLQEISSTIDKNTSYITNVNEKAKEAAISMEDISKSSMEINNIIDVINNIAFQTNLLALNASIEAARAGEVGKGFDVVAQEVRNLAQKSASEAKNIDNLVKSSLDKINFGVEIVESITNQINDITVAFNDQSRSIKQIYSAIDELNSIAQQNAAQVEQTSASTEEISAQAEEMDDSVNLFKTDDHFIQKDFNLTTATKEYIEKEKTSNNADK
jgi:methyl-accepting chemotaxis protein